MIQVLFFFGIVNVSCFLWKASKKKKLEKAPKPAALKKGTKAQSKLIKKTDFKVKRKVPKVK